MTTVEKPTQVAARSASLPVGVAAAGGIAGWNESHVETRNLSQMLESMCTATTVEGAYQEIQAISQLGHKLWAYAYMRKLYSKNLNLYYAVLLAYPKDLLPIVYTPTVGEACQKFGRMPFYARGCYINLDQRGKIREVLREYAEVHMEKGPDGKFLVDCMVFSDGGRILGLGDLGTWGMGIPIGKLDLYTVCAGVNPYRTIPLIIDAGIDENTDKVDIRENPLYTGMVRHRVKQQSAAGTQINSAYYGEGNFMDEFFEAATDVFGPDCLLQFEDFNSNDAFPLLAHYREKYLTYNDDIQGTAAVTVAAILGAIKLKNPTATDLIALLQNETFLLHGAGSANLGAAGLLIGEAKVPANKVFLTNSRGLIWKSEDGTTGSYRNDEQKAVAQVGEPEWKHKTLFDVVSNVKPTSLVGAVGVVPGCFDAPIVAQMVEHQPNGGRPTIFALSNPKTQAECTAAQAYAASEGKVIFGSGTEFPPVTTNGKTQCPGQVNNVYIFPGMSFGAVSCKATKITEKMFLLAAQAVANSLDETDLAEDRVVPNPSKIRTVNANVATAVVLEAQSQGLARVNLGSTWEEVYPKLIETMWSPTL